jgi:UDP:flavonoid glycosyltransferase YjiC (YdhE family)
VAQPDFDVVIAGDMTRWGERSLRIAQEVRSYAASGKNVGLVNTSRLTESSRIAPEVQTCVRRGLATVVKVADLHTADLLIVHGPSEIEWTDKPLINIHAQNAVLVCHDRADYTGTRLSQRIKAKAGIHCAPTNAWLRGAAPARARLTQDDWQPMLDALPLRRAPATGRRRPRIGWIMGPGHAQLPATDAAEIVPLGEDLLPHLSLDRLALLDGLAYFPPSESEELLDTFVLAAAKMGVAVAAPSWLKRHYKSAVIFCAAEDALVRLTAKLSTKRPLRGTMPRSELSRDERQRPVMFVASNGVGVGHVSRLLAIARRMDTRTPLLFATQAQAVPAIERLGYLAEYMSSANYVGGDFAQWDSWFRHDLETLVDAYDPALVVYDGNNPSHGLMQAVTARRDCGLAWIRRGMWGPLNSPFMDNARWFDLIIEPGELEGQADEGITAQRRDEAVLVPPIRLLDSDELFPRAEAARRLGLDPSQPSVLIQLGAGYNRDVVTLVDALITELQRVDKLQVCVAEWLNGTQPLNYWQGVSYLRGYPLSQYFKAFDFSISAAGYNTFHEIMNFDLPTIFIPNRHPSMDDQAGRSTLAQARQAAFEVDESDLADLPDLIGLLMDGKARSFLASNSASLHQANGAADAARLLTQLHRAAQ